MHYLDIETIQLFIYFLFYEWKGSDHRDFISYSEKEGFYPEMHQFNMAVYRDIHSNSIEDAFILSKSRDFDDSVFICLDDESKLINFLQEYIREFRNDELFGDTNIFPYEVHLKYMKRELEFHSLHYKNKFNLTAKPRDENNSKETTACGLRIFEFLLFLYFHKNQYLKIKSCNQVLFADSYLHLKENFFNIALEVEFSKPIFQIFEELYIELKDELTNKSLQKMTIDGYTIEKLTDGIDKGKTRIIYKNRGEGLLSSDVRRKVFIYLLKNNNKNLNINDVIKNFAFKGKPPTKSLETYIREINVELRRIHKPETRKQYIKPKKNDIIVVRIP